MWITHVSGQYAAAIVPTPRQARAGLLIDMQIRVIMARCIALRHQAVQRLGRTAIKLLKRRSCERLFDVIDHGLLYEIVTVAGGKPAKLAAMTCPGVG